MQGQKVVQVFLVTTQSIRLAQCWHKVEPRELPGVFNVSRSSKSRVVPFRVVSARPSITYSPVAAPRYRQARAAQFTPKQVPGEGDVPLAPPHDPLGLIAPLRPQTLGSTPQTRRAEELRRACQGTP